MTNAESLSVDSEDFIQDFSVHAVDIIRKMAPEMPREELEGGLTSVFRDAVKLSRVLRCQRAYWYVRYPVSSFMKSEQAELSSKMRFDGTFMEDGDEEDDEDSHLNKTGAVVGLVVQPGLIKEW